MALERLGNSPIRQLRQFSGCKGDRTICLPVHGVDLGKFAMLSRDLNNHDSWSHWKAARDKCHRSTQIEEPGRGPLWRYLC